MGFQKDIKPCSPYLRAVAVGGAYFLTKYLIDHLSCGNRPKRGLYQEPSLSAKTAM